MRLIVYAAALILIATAAFGFWLQSLGVDGARFAQKFGLAPQLWPLAFPSFGAVIAGLIAYKNRAPIKRCWRSQEVRKPDVRAALAILFGPLLALLLQSYAGLAHFELTDKDRMMTGLAIADFVFFAAMGNYASTLRAGAPGGLRTPWTLKSERVWVKTHRYLGRGLLAISAAALFSLTVLQPYAAIMTHLGVLIAFKLTAVAFSYTLWRDLRKQQSVS